MLLTDERISALGRHADIITAVTDRINNILKRPLHDAQVQVAKDYFVKGNRVCMSQWGRNGGKTEGILYIANVAAMLTDNFWTMIVCPTIKQGKKIYWNKKRLQNYPPPQFVKEYGTTDLKIEYKNGSLVTIEGCENYENLRGAKPNLVIYDEFQLHSREFHLEVMEPNLVEESSALFIFGTPPKERSAYYVEFREELLKSIKEGDSSSSYHEFSAYVNPANSKEQLNKRRTKLIASGNEVLWQREYEGKLVFGGADVVFPKWNPKVHRKTHKVLMSYLEKDQHKLKWYTICDPGTSSCFAVLFACYNPYTQQIFLLDEIYEKDRQRTDTRQIFDRIRKKEKELYPTSEQKDWIRIYDEAAAWFQREVIANYKHQYGRISLIPSLKQHNEKEDEISRIKMLMAEENSLHVSDRCYWWQWEIESFITDEKGNYPKLNDHLIDTTIYLMHHCLWKLIEKGETDIIPVTPLQTQASKVIDVAPNEWADNVVEDSLSGDNAYDRPRSILDDWF